jgi:hypothetical protein
MATNNTTTTATNEQHQQTTSAVAQKYQQKNACLYGEVGEVEGGLVRSAVYAINAFVNIHF